MSVHRSHERRAVPRHLSFSLLLSVVILLAGIMYSIPLLREKQVQERTQLQLTDRLLLESARNADLNHRIAAVKSDARLVERLGREKFGLARTGEVVFKFRGDLPPATDSTPR
jgi:cell division protein FtsB